MPHCLVKQSTHCALLDPHIQRISLVLILSIAQIRQVRIVRDHGVLCSKIARVVDAPVDFSYLSCWMCKPLQNVAHQDTGTETDSHRFDGIHDLANNVRTRLHENRSAKYWKAAALHHSPRSNSARPGSSDAAKHLRSRDQQCRARDA